MHINPPDTQNAYVLRKSGIVYGIRRFAKWSLHSTSAKCCCIRRKTVPPTPSSAIAQAQK
jgi:hypothetical protein